MAGGTRQKLIVRNALLLPMQDRAATSFIGYMAVDDLGRISHIGPGEPPAGLSASQTIDAAGKIVLPGFVSAHSHLYQSAFRGIGANSNTGEWRKEVHVYSVPCTDEDVYWFTLHGALSHLINGVTSLFNFSYNARVGDYNINQLDAQLESGVRFIHGFAQNRSIPVERQYESFLAYHDYAKDRFSDPQFLRLGITGSGQALEDARFDKRLMDDFGALNQAHFLSEAYYITRDGRRQSREEVQGNFQNFIDAGTLGPDQYFGHFIHTNDHILEETVAAGSAMSWQPLSNGRLGSGIADIPKYLKAGLKIGMGVDGEASADIASPFENMRMGLYMIRASYGTAAVMPPSDVLWMSTLGGAGVMGVADRIGSLEVGKFADFLIVTPPSPVFDVVATIVLAAGSTNIDAVYVGGNKLVDRLSFTRIDSAKVDREVESRIARVRPH
ncbi:MAG TPA: amidohydrolase family protein [Alphaproteobacteria bacterium]|jgi:cytosine/adenosine deaminase-related metal-dependent hydrolase|nr:amidohydrolase family protein [Alphaproteobacteria bacterium]